MGFSMCTNSKVGLVHVCAEGILKASDIDGYYAQLKAVEGISTCNKALVDLMHSSVNIKQVPIRNIKALGLMFQNAPVLPPEAKMAVTVQSALAYGFVRLFMGSRGDGLIIRPFRKMDEALVWLGISESDLPNVPHVGD